MNWNTCIPNNAREDASHRVLRRGWGLPVWSLMAATALLHGQFGMAQTPGLPNPAFSPAGPLAAPEPALPPHPPSPATARSTAETLRDLTSQSSLCIVIGEEFARSYLSQETCDEGPVQDCILGAQVSGTQQTRARVNIDFTPCAEAARFVLILNGVTTNQTVSQTPQARIHTQGEYQFRLTKQAEFDGTLFRTWSPAAFLNISQRHLGAQTPVSSVPLLGPLANAAALSAAEQRRPLSQRIAAQRVTEHVAPRFNNEFDQKLAQLNRQISQSLRPRLAEWNVEPQAVFARSTDDALLIGAGFSQRTEHSPMYRPQDPQPALPRLLAPVEVPITDPLPEPSRIEEFQPIENLQRDVPLPLEYQNENFVPEEGPTVPGLPRLRLPEAFRGILSPVSTRQWGADSVPVPQQVFRVTPDAPVLSRRLTAMLHESLIGDLSTGSTLAGLELPDTALERMFQGEAVDRSEPAGVGLATILFSREQPLSTSIRDGQLLLHARVAFRPILGPMISEQVITIAVQPFLGEHDIRLQFTFHSMRAAVPGEETGLVGAAAEEIIRKSVESKLRDVTLPRSLELPREGAEAPFPVRIAALTLENGWLSLSLEPNLPASPATPDRQP